MDSALIPEFLLRGATAGILLLLSAILIRSDGYLRVRLLGALFLVASAGYAIVASPIIADRSDFFFYPLTAISSINGVFFWWFVTVLFDDEFAWKPWRLAPFVIMVALFVIRWFILPEWNGSSADIWLHNGINLVLIAHVLWLALVHRKDDLVEPRRQFRLILAFVVGLLIIVISVGEILIDGAVRPLSLTFWHALILFVLSFGFTVWQLRPGTAFAILSPHKIHPRADTQVSHRDAPHITRLNSLMNDGIYLSEGLSVAGLAAKVGIPEHRLRRIINDQLGFRNFTAFLNERRLADARRILSDPAKAQLQITEIALELGYGSVGPFNRAFKAETGQTPTTFRQAALQMSNGGSSNAQNDG